MLEITTCEAFWLSFTALVAIAVLGLYYVNKNDGDLLPKRKDTFDFTDLKP